MGRNKEEEEEKNLSPEELSKKRLRDFLEMAVELVIVVVLVFLFIRFVAFRSVVRGDSMNATLQDRNNLIVERVSYYFHQPNRFDIVVFRSPIKNDAKEHYIKRVIGLPGETLEIREGYVYINGEQLTSDTYGLDVMYSDPSTKSEPLNFGPVEIAEEEYFVLGDNRNNSKDSRMLGPIAQRNIMGRVWVRFFPFNSMRAFPAVKDS